MSIHPYPVIDVDAFLASEAVQRSGSVWWRCDAPEGCDHEVEVTSDAVPDGWSTSDPDDNVMRGAAQFCPDHQEHAPPPQPSSVPAPTYDEVMVQLGVEQAPQDQGSEGSDPSEPPTDA